MPPPPLYIEPAHLHQSTRKFEKRGFNKEREQSPLFASALSTFKNPSTILPSSKEHFRGFSSSPSTNYYDAFNAWFAYSATFSQPEFTSLSKSKSTASFKPFIPPSKGSPSEVLKARKSFYESGGIQLLELESKGERKGSKTNKQCPKLASVYSATPLYETFGGTLPVLNKLC